MQSQWNVDLEALWPHFLICHWGEDDFCCAFWWHGCKKERSSSPSSEEENGTMAPALFSKAYMALPSFWGRRSGVASCDKMLPGELIKTRWSFSFSHHVCRSTARCPTCTLKWPQTRSRRCRWEPRNIHIQFSWCSPLAADMAFICKMFQSPPHIQPRVVQAPFKM